mmetsp:Transcript_13023/g.27467  ORF Transcript_13023/g.27467 Transcript_13023/m.27467 type:complete len:217 (+) Transcript_13023:276-926(+)
MISAKEIQIMHPAAKPAKKGKREENTCTKAYAGTASRGCGMAVTMVHIVSSPPLMPLDARTVATARPSGMLCRPMATVTRRPFGSVTKMMPLVCGDTSEGTDDANACNINEIANPDNVAYVGDGLDTILFAEDTTKHENNILWAYDPNTNTKERILMVPLGAEVTSPYLYTLGDWSYIMAVAQHPYQKKGDDLAGASSSGRSGNVGYIGPLKLSAA